MRSLNTWMDRHRAKTTTGGEKIKMTRDVIAQVVSIEGAKIEWGVKRVGREG